MILVTAGYGNQGRLLIPKLTAAGHHVRAARVTAGGEDDLRRLGAQQVFIGDLSDVDTYTRALEGIDAVYHIGPATHPREEEMGLAMIEAAQRAGVRHVVFSSVHYSIVDILQHRIKMRIEEKLFESGLNYTILKPCDFMMDAMYFTPVIETGELPIFWECRPDRRGSFIDVGDLTDVAATVLVEGAKHYHASYELVGPDKLTASEIARIFSRVLDRNIEFVQKQPEDLVRIIHGTDQPTPKTQRAFDVMYSAFAWYTRYEFIGNPNVLTWLLGRPPTTFEQYVATTYGKYLKAH